MTEGPVRRASRQLCIALACVVSACGQAPPQQETQAASRQFGAKRAPREPSRAGLEPAQEEALARLVKLSQRPLEAQVWERAGTLSRLELDIPTSDKGSDPLAAAQAFLKENAALWKLTAIDRLRAKVVKTSARCSRVVFQLQGAGDRAVLNAALAVDVSSEGTVHRAVGRLSGEPLPDAKWSAALLEDEALVPAKVRAALAEPELGLPAASEVWLDRYFFDSGQHELRPALQFTSPTELDGKGEVSTSVVVSETGSVGIGFTSSKGSSLDEIGCEVSGPASVLPKVVVDPGTQTPTHVDLRASGGIPTQGSSPEQRAFDLLAKEPLLRMFGSLEPSAHLGRSQVTSNARGETVVHFQQLAQGLPVEGGHLSVVLSAAGFGLEVFGRFAYRPLFATRAALSLASALKEAVPAVIAQVCGDDSACRKEEAARAPTTELVVLSSELVSGTRLPKRAARLAWKIDVAGRTTYWDAEATAAGSLYAYPTEREFNYTISKGNQIEIENPGTGGSGIATAGITPDPDSVAVAALLDPDVNNPIEAFFAARGWRSYDNAGGQLRVFVRHGQSRQANWSPASDGIPDRLLLGPGWTQSDVIAHEFTHGVTQYSAGFVNFGEPGGLGESYSDVIASVIFPDTPALDTWLMGEASPLGAYRDLRTPELNCSNNPGLSNCFPGWRHYAQIDPGCAGNEDEPWCKPHRYSGIASLAAVLISDGGTPGSSHPGVGRAKLGELAFRSLTSGLFGPHDRLLQHAVVMGQVCDDLAAVGRAGFTFADCDHVRASLLQVGLAAQVDYGWFRFPQTPGGFRTNQAYFSGQRLFRGCTISSHTLTATDPARTSSVTGTDMASLAIDLGVWGVRFTQRGADTDPTDRSYTLRVWSQWYESGQVDVRDDWFLPPSVRSRGECLLPPVPPGSPPNHLRTLYSTAVVAHWAVFLDGGRGDVEVNSTSRLPLGCAIQRVAGIEYHHGVTQSGASQMLDHSEHGFTVSRSTADTADLTTRVHWWHTGISGVFVRVAYTIQEDDGVDCAVPGALQQSY